jgi:general stress protein 26
MKPTLSLFVGLVLFSMTLIRPLQADQLTLSQAVEQAHAELWGRFVDSHGIIRDFVGELPTSEDCALGRPNAIGWWSPIEDGPMFTGLYLQAACERARRTGDAMDKDNARRLMLGLIKCASVSDVAGFIARGIGTDGMCHYPLGSDDQTHPWFLGLHAYFTSGFASDEERKQIAAKVKEVAEVLETTAWKCPCDGAFKGDFRGGFQGHLFRDAVRYLFMLRATHEITNDPVWLARYQKALVEKPTSSTLTRVEICAEGYPHDREAIKNIDEYGLWIYVGSQASLAKLIAMESDESVCAKYRAGLAINARNALVSIEAHAQFDNQDTEVFGHADWRKGYPNWFPQRTQADAQKLSEMGDKAFLGKRKSYESRYMRNPLAAAAIIALAGDNADRAAVERSIRHYDYSKINLSVFFFAECAYYALPAKP